MNRTTKKQAVTVFAPAIEGGFDVSFPEYPGCVTFGRNLREAKLMAREVLQLWLEESGIDQRPLRRKAMVTTITLPRRTMFTHAHEATHRQKTHSYS